MIIEVLNIEMTPDGSVSTITVTDGNEIRDVTPNMIFDALLNGRMESNTARLTLTGIEVLCNSQITSITLSMSATTRKMVKLRLGMDIRTEKEKKITEASAKEAKLAAERAAAKEKQKQWFEENKRKADEARANGLIRGKNGESIRPRAKVSLSNEVD